MRISWLLAKIFIIAGITAALGFAVPATPIGKLDTWNYIQFDKIIQADQLGLLQETDGELSVILTVASVSEALKAFPSLGVRPRTISGNIVTAEISIAHLHEVLTCQGILSLKICEQRHNPVIDLPSPSAKAVVGIVDTGLTLHNGDFLDNEGRTRIVAFWDQTQPGMAGPYLSGPTSGKLYTGKELLWYLAQKEKTQTPGHGAVVAAIAAGNKTVKTYDNMAADIENTNSPILLVETTKDEGDIIDAVAFIKAQCAAWNLPGVVNLSYGKHNGPHDGTSLVSQALTNMVASDFLIVVSAGNEGQSNIYAHRDVRSSGMIDFTIAKSGEKTSSAKGIAIYGWHNKEQQGVITLLSPSGQEFGPVDSGHWQEWVVPYGDIVISNGVSDGPGNNDEIQVVIQNTKPNTPIPDGVWHFKLEAPEMWSTDFWLVSNPGYSCKFMAAPGDTEISISDIATGEKLIAVGGYIFNEQSKQFIATGESGKGPTRDRRQKPDVLAPWSVRTATKQNRIIPAAGTSFSAPLITRLITAVWSRNPEISGETLRGYLKNKILILEPEEHPQPKISAPAGFTLISWDECEKEFQPLLSN